MNEQKTLALYHYLSAIFFIFPVIGIVAVAIYRLRRKGISEIEEEHYYSVLNFQLISVVFILAPFVILSSWLAFIAVAIICAYGAWTCIKNGKQVTKGEPYSYPLAIKLVTPRRKSIGVEEMMYREKNPDKK